MSDISGKDISARGAKSATLIAEVRDLLNTGLLAKSCEIDFRS